MSNVTAAQIVKATREAAGYRAEVMTGRSQRALTTMNVWVKDANTVMASTNDSLFGYLAAECLDNAASDDLQDTAHILQVNAHTWKLVLRCDNGSCPHGMHVAE